MGTVVRRYGYVALLLLTVCGCGGGGDGGGLTPPPLTLLATLQAILSGANEPTVVDAEARAAGVVELLSDGTVNFSLSLDGAWAPQLTGAHIHRGATGVDGAVVADLLGGGATVDPVTFTLSGTITISDTLASEIAAAPDDFYLNVHTATAPQGLARGQIAPFAPIEWHATMRGSEETTVVDATARGAAALALTTPASLEFAIAMANPAIADVVGAHIHLGNAGVPGPIVVDLGADPAAVTDAAAGTRSGTLAINRETLARLLANPGGFYVNVHTAAAPQGAARGQLQTGTVSMWAPLSGNEETSVIDAAARGGVMLELTTFTSGTMELAVPPAQGINNVTSAHVHVGAAGVNGNIIIDLLAGSDLSRSPVTGSAEGTITYTQPEYARLLANPAGYYANIHTAAAPLGLARGQLTQTPASLFAILSGAQELTSVNPAAAGTLSVLLTGAGHGSFTLTMTTPPIGDVTAAHVHDGATGVNGPALMDLLGGTGITVVGNKMSGDFTFSGRTFARLLAAPQLFYGNAHTSAAPLGIARGQFTLRTDAVAPNSLVYSTPVVYLTGVAITPNTPTSGGGAVANYAVTPPLPSGLTLNSTTGVISGTPTSVSAATNYTVTASNAAGSTTATVNITVNLSPPSSLSYTTPVTFVVGTAITPLSPSHSGGAITNYTVSPALPGGLTLNATTGVISGTPTAATAAANYTVTGSNSAGSKQATINITVNSSLQPPSGLSYSTPVSYPTGYAITANNPTVGGGAVTTWSISPALPAGLSFNSSTGSITGTPTTVTSGANYTVTASNGAGSTTATVNITVTLGAPTSLTYDIGFAVGYINTANPTMTPSSSGGAVSSYSISPALPAGLSISSSTGVISGTPTVTSALTTYTVTASNATGSTTVTVQIVVY